MNIMQASVGKVGETRVVTMRNGRVSGLLIGETLYVLGRSSSSFRVTVPSGYTAQFICQDGCCDRGLQPDVADLVAAAKALGAAEVVIRTGQRQFYVPEIHGLPVHDVSNRVGTPVEGVSVWRR